MVPSFLFSQLMCQRPKIGQKDQARSNGITLSVYAGDLSEVTHIACGLPEMVPLTYLFCRSRQEWERYTAYWLELPFWT